MLVVAYLRIARRIYAIGIAIEKIRNQPLIAMAPIIIANMKNRTLKNIISTPILRNLGLFPYCIGKNIVAMSPNIEFPIISKPIIRIRIDCSDTIQTPIPKEVMNKQTMNDNIMKRVLFGDPMALSSLMDCAEKLYPFICPPTILSVTKFRRGAMIPQINKIISIIVVFM